MKARILVIEDEMSINDLLCMNLEIAGYETVHWLRYLVSQDQESSKQGRGKNTGGCNVV